MSMYVQESLSDAWVVRPRPNPHARVRLFCFPYAGGAASIFYAWLDDLPYEVEICAIQLPGRERRLKEVSFTRMEPLLEALAPMLQPYLDKPFAFFGHSLGAMISFELARRLRRQSAPQPIHLFVSGSRAPQVPGPGSPIHHLPDEAFVEELRRLNGTPEAVLDNAELAQLFLPILRADIALHETHVYTADGLLDCPISAFGGLQDEAVSQNDLAAWHEQTEGVFTLRMFPGDHFFLRSARSQLNQAIYQDLAKTLGQPGGGVP